MCKSLYHKLMKTDAVLLGKQFCATGSYSDAGLRGRSDGPLNLSRQGSTPLARPGSSRLWKQDRPPSRASDPLPLLADVLAGGHLSQDALLDLRVSFADNLSTR